MCYGSIDKRENPGEDGHFIEELRRFMNKQNKEAMRQNDMNLNVKGENKRAHEGDKDEDHDEDRNDCEEMLSAELLERDTKKVKRTRSQTGK